jgi:hypothetical protein
MALLTHLAPANARRASTGGACSLYLPHHARLELLFQLRILVAFGRQLAADEPRAGTRTAADRSDLAACHGRDGLIC